MLGILIIPIIPTIIATWIINWLADELKTNPKFGIWVIPIISAVLLFFWGIIQVSSWSEAASSNLYNTDMRYSAIMFSVIPTCVYEALIGLLFYLIIRKFGNKQPISNKMHRNILLGSGFFLYLGFLYVWFAVGMLATG